MTKAQAVHERIDALTAAGATKAEAFRALAEESGQPVKSLQGAYYQHAKKANGGSRSRKRETRPADALTAAVALLERAISDIDSEVEAAKARAEEATREYEALRESASTRQDAIQTKITALRA